MDYIHTDEEHDANMFAGLETLAREGSKTLETWGPGDTGDSAPMLYGLTSNFRMEAECWGGRLA